MKPRDLTEVIDAPWKQRVADVFAGKTDDAPIAA